ncbi:MAG TPA: EamA family transporter [Chloroflexota bacterium]|jgi:DME family drug/metabolite transporter
MSASSVPREPLGASHDDRRGRWLVLAAAVLFGTTGTAQAFAPPGAQPLAVGTVRLLIGGGALLVLALARGVLPTPKRWPLLPTVAAAIGVAAYQVCFFAGVAATGVAVGTVVALGCAPIFAGLLGLRFHGERPDRRWLLATALAVVGCGLLIVPGGGLRVEPIGVLLALGAAASYTVYAAEGKRLLHNFPPDAVMAATFGLGAALLSPILLVVDLHWLWQPRGVLVAMHLGLVATALAYALFARGLKEVPTATAVTLTLAEPLTAATLGLVVLGERLTAPALLGVGLLLAPTLNTSRRTLGRRSSKARRRLGKPWMGQCNCGWR